MTNRSIKQLKIRELFSSNDQYLIPIYQRNYAWEKGQVEQLIQDILDYAKMYEEKTYYIGTLVVYEKAKNSQIIYETIDGQQRLTTLSILLSVIKNRFDIQFDFKHILSYESRESSNKTFKTIYKQSGDNNIFIDSDDYNASMKNAYEIIETKIKNLKKDNLLENFSNYLLDHVEILRVNVPDDTDLNHYFEIMNNRGEQLEKHEVLKAQMLGSFDKDEHHERTVFSKIWDACSDMSRYVQNYFKVKERSSIFTEQWDSFAITSFDNLLQILEPNNDNNSTKTLTLEQIIDGKNNYLGKNRESTNSSERFTSPINFQNFLLHVLRIHIMNGSNSKQDIQLDDKRLLDSFRPYINNKKFVKDFAFNLLKLKYLFDNFIIKRDYNKNSEDGEWSLFKANKYEHKKRKNLQYKNRFNNESENKQLIMLLSMFHVSNPSQIYKHWVSGVLNYLFKQNTDDINGSKYISYLEDFANKFFKRYVSKNQIDYFDIIFSSNLLKFDLDSAFLNQGTNVENFIFNYLDYLLWKADRDKYKYFAFTFKSSVEHFYPQHPKDGQDILPPDVLNSFGNLCLISASKNSSLSNYQPKAKADHYYKSGYDSVKQQLMIEKMEKADHWWINEIREHQEEMLEVLGL